jgi:hypothetical protein
MTIKFNDILPPLTADEFKQLEANILADGIRDPLIKWGDVLIDGHNRYKIAQKHGLEYKTVQMEFDSDEAVMKWIVANQTGRRNLNDAQRLDLAMRLEPMLREMAKENSMANLKQNSDGANWSRRETGRTRDKIADVVGVGGSTVTRFKRVKEKGDEETVRKMMSGEISISAAFNQTKAQNPIKVGRPHNPRTGEPITEKTCTSCGRTLPAEKFYLSNGKLSYGCMQCERMKKREGISPTIREDIESIQAASESLTDLNRVMEYTVSDVIETIESEFSRLLRVTDTEVRNHPDLMKDPANRGAVVNALALGVSLIQAKMNELVR